ncbi:MAG: hypothetical protein IJ776_02325 [Paludibacteraceae bacterium]|nr:hypothetical protein [Paludibacteraceae bacterium]
MKREGYIIEQAADMDNLRLAFHQAQCGKSGKQEVIRFREHLERNLLQLRKNLLEGKVLVGDYKLFRIYDPKERVVCAASFEERVMHHALMNVCAPRFEGHFINTTYANRKGKGAYKALETAHQAMGKYGYVAKMDVRKYFDSIDHDVLKSMLCRLFKDKRLLQVLNDIIGSYETSRGKGLPIGNLTSQYFANYYLSLLDHYAKQTLRVPVYIRYMDDILIFGDSMAEIKDNEQAITAFVSQKLFLRMKPPQISQTTKTIAFLGYSLCGRRIGLTARSKRRFESKYRMAEKNLNECTWSQAEYQSHVIPLFAFVRHGYTKKYRETIIN